jgi:hypothetical protein
MKSELGRADVLRLAAESQLDPRTVKRAIDRGVDSLKSEYDKTRLKDAALRLGLRL